MIRFARAFAQALRLTLLRQTPAPAHYRPLQAWMRQSLALLDQAERLATTESLDASALRLKLDGRMTSLSTALKMLRHNLTEAYPRLIRLDDPHSMTVLQSSNMNDQYRIARFAASDQIASAALRQALNALDAHLHNLPAINRPP